MTTKLIIGLASAAALAALVSGCVTESRPAGQAVATAPAAAPSGSLESQAMAFESFMRRGRAIDPDFSNAGDVSQALQTGASHEPMQLDAGMIAYAAVAALQEPSFVEGVRRQGRGSDLARRLGENPNVALTLPGGQAAAGRASAALLRQGQALTDNGLRVKHAAYTVQHSAWSKTNVANPKGRLAEVKRLSATAYRPEPGDAARLRAAVAESGPRTGAASPVVARGVALAALSVLGEDGRGRALMQDPSSASCLHMAKLNLYQCLASAGPQYEDIFCLGQHAMIEPGQCVADGARGHSSQKLPVTKASWQP
jgi:hypothetical protein